MAEVGVREWAALHTLAGWRNDKKGTRLSLLYSRAQKIVLKCPLILCSVRCKDDK